MKPNHPFAPLDAIDTDVSHHAPVYLEAIKAFLLRHVGPERAGLALRCEQAARYMKRIER